MENVAGRSLVEAGALCERKNGRGVDTNRNWGIDWGKKEKDYDPKEEYPGSAPHRHAHPEATYVRPRHPWTALHHITTPPALSLPLPRCLCTLSSSIDCVASNCPRVATCAANQRSKCCYRSRASSRHTHGSTCTVACLRCLRRTITRHRCPTAQMLPLRCESWRAFATMVVNVVSWVLEGSRLGELRRRCVTMPLHIPHTVQEAWLTPA